MPSLKLSEMANKRAFEIAFVGLKAGVHEFSYEIDDKFFAEKGAHDISNVKATVKLFLEKHTGFMMLKFDIGGTAEASCDRCGNPLKLDLWDEFKMLVKLVDDPIGMNESEEDPDVFYISHTESHIEVSNWIYEFVMLSIPMHRVCPVNEAGASQCNQETLEKLKEMEAKQIGNNAKSLWKDLDKFKEN